MKYYLHDSNAFQDEKVTKLFQEFGYEGLGLFYTILEKLAYQEKPVDTSVLKCQLKVGKKLEKCWKFMESLGIISSNNGETFNKQLLNYSEKFKIKKEKNAKRISEWREKQEIEENVTRYESVRNAPKVNRSKVNRIEVKEEGSASTPFSQGEILNLIQEQKKVIENLKKEIEEEKKKKEKSSAKKEKETSTLYMRCIDVYFKFCEKITDTRPVWDKKTGAIEGEAMKKIIVQLKSNNKIGNNEENVLTAWVTILRNWNKLDKFYQEQIRINDINRNLLRILNNLKNGKTGIKQIEEVEREKLYNELYNRDETDTNT